MRTMQKVQPLSEGVPEVSAPTVEQLLRAMVGKRALVVGDLMLDAYVYGETVRVSREAPVLVVRKERTEYRLGGAANTAANLAALGLDAKVLGVVGTDTAGERLSALLSDAGVDLRALQRVGRMTPLKTRILAGAFGTARQQVLRLDDEPSELLHTSEAAAVAADLMALADEADVIVVSDYGSGVVAPPVVNAARSLVRAGKVVCVDSRFDLPSFGGVTAITPNVPEAEAASGVTITDQRSCERAGQVLMEKVDCDACLLTQGRGGMTLFCRNEAPRHIDIVGKAEVTDVTGAGDTVIATFAAVLAVGGGMVNAMQLANCAAGIVVTRVGTATAQPAEIVRAALAGAVEMLPWA